MPVEAEGSLCGGRRLATLAIWALLYLLGFYQYILRPIHQDVFGCFSRIIRNTLRIYNVTFVLITYTSLGIVANIFCLVRMYRRDVLGIFRRISDLHTKIKGVQETPEASGIVIKFLLFYVYILPFVVSLLVSMYSVSVKESTSPLWFLVLHKWLLDVILLPAPVMCTVFYIMMDISRDSFSLICKRLAILARTMNPKPFVQEISSVRNLLREFKNPAAINLHSVRVFHDEITDLMENLMKEFQPDILVFFLAAFYHNVMYNYSIVYNGSRVLQSEQELVFVVYNIHGCVWLMISRWLICAGPSRMQSMQRELLSRVTRLSAAAYIPADVKDEMCASIVSYIVVLMQFAIEPENAASYTSSHGNSTTAEPPL
ncbi:hypothetical protein J6590_082294 [Homalodisca vitripennis]|nr:hypothetical protein J6590_082294 [Homalodisca vitripennis]